MATQNLSDALHRAENVLRRRPETGLQDDATATAEWQSGTRVVSTHANGFHIATDMPSEVGGSGNRVTPSWLFRASLASCAATSIAMSAAAQGIELKTLKVRASSRSDTRGLLGMTDPEGTPVSAGPSDLRLLVRISAEGISQERLLALVEEGCRCSPIPNAVQNAVPLLLRIEIAED
jgi:uncharacterized OsmC-like protein